jgi:hypothetical protein
MLANVHPAVWIGGAYVIVAFLDNAIDKMMKKTEPSIQAAKPKLACKEVQERPASMWGCWQTYILSASAGGASAWACDTLIPGCSPVYSGLAATVASTLVAYAHSLAYGNSSLFDPYWCLLPQVFSKFPHETVIFVYKTVRAFQFFICETHMVRWCDTRHLRVHISHES